MASSGTWMVPSGDPRTAIDFGRSERTVLAGYLDHYRLTIELKCADLTPEQLATRSVPPSSLSLLGLLRHLARVEHSWTRRVIEGQESLPRLYSAAEGDLDFDGAVGSPDVVEEARATWLAEVAHAREVYATLDLDGLFRHHHEQTTGRSIIVHLIEEYARHAGHADLLREAIDGRTGA